MLALDGVIQAPGGADEDTEGGFTHGGWTVPYWHDDIGAHFFQAMSRADAFLLGRKTWQIHGGAFEPMKGDPFADSLNNIPKYVVSTTLQSASAWRNSTIIRDDSRCKRSDRGRRRNRKGASRKFSGRGLVAGFACR